MKRFIAIVAPLLVVSTIYVSAVAGEKVYQRVGGVSADNLCDAGTVFKTIEPVFVCDQWLEIPSRGSGEHFVPGDWKCTAPRMTQLDIQKATLVCLQTVTNESFSGCVLFGEGIQSSTVLMGDRWMKDNIAYYDYKIPRCDPERKAEPIHNY